MNPNRWLRVILMLGLILVLSPLGAQADPYQPFDPHPNYHRPHGNAYGWRGRKPHGYDHHPKDFRRSCMGPSYPRPYAHQVYGGPPPVAYVTPVAPIIGIPSYPQQQPAYSPPASPGLHGQITF
jgi:hypothetical protein